METNQFLFFCGHKAGLAGNFCSQWYPCKFVEKKGGVKTTYSSAEQYMMAHKALLFGDNDTADKIMSTDSPALAKKLGRIVKNFDQYTWDSHKFAIVLDGNRLKFGQNEELKQKLLATGAKTIVEAAHYDKVWGIGLTAQQAFNTPMHQWPGQNLLGEALMQVRHELMD